jgi:hypothetical protein
VIEKLKKLHIFGEQLKTYFCDLKTGSFNADDTWYGLVLFEQFLEELMGRLKCLVDS